METRVHISLEVANLNESIAFYKALFKQEPTKVQEDYANFRMEGPTLHLALVHTPNRQPEPANTNRHFGIELFTSSSLAQWQTSAEAAGLKVRTEEQITCCYAVADKFWAHDPDGHAWEFWVRHEEANSMHGDAKVLAAPPKNQCCAPGQC